MDNIDIDTQWLDELEAHEATYDDFYEEPQKKIDCFILAVDSQNNLSHISKTSINTYTKLCQSRQRLEDILLFRISASPEDIISLHLGTDNITRYAPGCDIVIAPSPRSIHKVNAIFLIGREHTSVINTTRRVRINFARKTRRK
jgi:hypothetical protein